MFGRQNDLPVHGGSQKNNGISGIPVVNKWVAGSVLWVVVSIIVFFCGIWHCRNNGYSYNLKCNPTECTYTAIKGSEVSFTFPKSDLIDADLARLTDKGEFIDAEQMRKMKNNRAGYSIRFKARLPIEEGSKMKTEKAIILSPRDMGRREARNGVTSITKYIHSSETATIDSEKESLFSKTNKHRNIDIHHGRSFTAFGAISSMLSVVSLIFAFLFGTWSETSRRARVKKAS